MKKQIKLLAVLLTVMAIGFTGCKTEVTVPDGFVLIKATEFMMGTNVPKEVANIQL